MNIVSNNKQSLTNDAEGMGATKRLFVDLWANETTIQRKRIVVEVPSDTEDGEIESIGGTALIIIADEQQADIEDTGNKQLILVPKNHIHHGFFDDDCVEFVLPGERRASRWAVQSNFCSTSKNDAKTKLLKKFLLADVRDLRNEGRLAAIATHRALVGQERF